LIEQRSSSRGRSRADRSVAVDEQRLAQEVAILADKLDVSEVQSFSLALFGIPCDARLADARRCGQAAAGFLLQELLREANTTGSKANDAWMLQDVILIKEELERIREQVENLE
jgi:uncharacterized protein (TIGR00255 family)